MRSHNPNTKYHISIDDETKHRSIDWRYVREAAEFKPVDEEKRYIPETYCSFFGCGKLLTLAEKLCGCRCIDHMDKKVFMFYGDY